MATSVWDGEPIVFVPIPVCPHCSCREYLRIRTENGGGDGSYSQKRVCSRCSRRYVAVFELPESGKSEVDNS
jgi:hypothetical protein